MRWAWVLVVAGCAPARPEKLESPARIEHEPVHVAPELAPRPDVDLASYLPDFHDELRWPLTALSHPVLEPRFDIADAFAEPGVGWIELCGRGVQNRYGGDKELLAYLRGWCNAVNKEADAACANLVPLLGSTMARMSDAVRADLANILADAGHADKAEHLINAHHIRDIELFDLLAANYVEVGTNDDAIAINRVAIDADDFATPATKCIRWTKHIVLSGDHGSALFPQIEAFAKDPKHPDATCAKEWHKLQCWAHRSCREYFTDEKIDYRFATLLELLDSWNHSAGSAHHWWSVAGTAALAFPAPGYDALMVDAIYNAVQIEPCNETNAQWVATQLKSMPAPRDPERLSRLNVVLDKCRRPDPVVNTDPMF